MINTLNIGKVIYNKLKTISNNVYPLIADNGTSFPFIIYSRDSIIPSFCKDGCYEDDVTISVRIVSSTYFSGVELAQLVRENLTLHNYTAENMKIDSRMESATESYEQDSYVQTLTFNVKINNY